MRSILAAILLASAGNGLVLAQTPTLTCPAVSAATGKACDTFHYHVVMYRPDTRGFVEVYGGNQFASQSACDRARDAQFKRNMAVVELYRTRGDQQYPPDRFGPCHCDMTVERTSPNYLNDMQRIGQLRAAEEIRQRVRERLLDQDVPSDSELIRGLIPPATMHPLVGGPKVVPLPQRAAVAEVTRSPDELKMTKAIDPSTTATVSLDLPLAEIPEPGVAAPPPSVAAPASGAEKPTAEAAVATQPAPTPTPPAPIQTTEVTPEEPPVEDAAESFVSFETQRIQNVIQASSAINDEAVRSKVLEACMQRNQLLSNLRSLIQGSGTKSRLAAAARNAKSEHERLGLVARLFGSDVPAHWAPKDAADVVVDTKDVDGDPERILRDSGGKFGETQKRHALYVLLARTQPTEEQQLWLSTVVEGLLQ